MDSIVPYRGGDNNSSVVLRHENSLVVFDHNSRQLALRSTTPPTANDAATAATLRPPTCPYCRQGISEEVAEEIRRDSAAAAAAAARNHHGLGGGHHHHHHGNSNSQPEEAGFITPEYFRILNARLLPDASSSRSVSGGAGSTHLSPPGSPRKRIPGIIGSLSGSAASSGGGQSGNGSIGGSDSGDSTLGTTGSIDERTSTRSRSSSTHKISSSAFSPGYFNQFFVQEKELGKGGNGVVLLVRHVLDGVNLGLFACKRVPVGDDHSWLAKVLMEVQLLQQLSHQNLVSYRHAWLEDMQLSKFGPSIPCAFILQQYCNSGDLQNFVYEKRAAQTKDQIKDQLRMRRFSKSQQADESRPKLLPFGQVISFFRDIAAGLNHLHSNGFIHRDLKPSNCLLHDTGVPGSELRVLVSDFGEVQRENAKRRSTGATGTISYCAPEVLRRDGPDGDFGNFTTKSDIFSLGMILHFMCFAKLPYLNSDEEFEENEEIEKLRDEISQWAGFNDKSRGSRGDIPDKVFKNLGRLLSVEPSKRPSAADILAGIRSEFGYGEDGIPRRAPLSPKTPNLGVADDGRFHRISPVPSSPSTPILTPANSLSRPPKGRNGHMQHKQHTRKASKLREITSELNLPESLSAVSNSGEASGTISTSLIQAAVSSDSSANSNSSSSSSSDEAPTMARTQSSSLILRPKRPSLTPREQQQQDGGSMTNGQTIMMPIESKPPALTAPPSPVNAKVAKGIRVTPQMWLVFKILLFFVKVMSLTNRCLPIAPNPWVFNSLLLLALVDLFGPFLFTTVILLVLHIIAFYITNRFDALCANSHAHGLFFF